MNTTAQIKQAIKKSAQQMAQEPLELLKSATSQVSGEELNSEVPPASTGEMESMQSGQDEQNYKQHTTEQDSRQLQALESELKDIRRQKLFNELMKRIQSGEDVPLEEFSELSYEQRDVLKAQIEAVRNSKLSSSIDQLETPSAKRGRKMGGGQKGAAKRETTRVEKPVPPSG